MNSVAEQTDKQGLVPIREHYHNYSPPQWVRPTIERLLSSVSKSCGELSAVVLTNGESAATLGRRKRRHGKRQIIGRYHARFRGEAPWIELVVDRIVEDAPRAVRWSQFARDLHTGRVLFHELGDHLDATVGATARAGEAAAEAWRKRLSKAHFRKHYWYVRPFLRPLSVLLHACLVLARKMAARDKQRRARRIESRR